MAEDNILDLGVGISADVSPFNHAIDKMAALGEKSFQTLFGSAQTYLGVSGLIHTFKQSTNAAAEFGQAMADMSAITDLSMKQINESIMKLPNYLGKATKVADTMYEVISSGFRNLDTSSLLRFQESVSKSAKVIRSDIYNTGNAITTLANAYKLNIDEIEKLSDWFYVTVREGKAHGDELARTLGLVISNAAESGTRIKELGAAIALLSRTQTTSQSMIGLNQAINAMIAPTLQAKAAAKKWGVDISANTLQSKGLASILTEIHNKLQGNTEAIEELFGNIRAGRAILALTGNQFNDFIAILKEYDNATGVADEAFKKQIDTLQTSLETVGVQFNKTMITIGSDLEPITRTLLTIGEAGLQGFGNVNVVARWVTYIVLVVEAIKKAKAEFTKAKEVINQFTNSLQKVDKVGTNNIAKEFEKANSSIKLINANLRKTDKLVIGITKTVKDLSTASTKAEKDFAKIKVAVTSLNVKFKAIVTASKAVTTHTTALNNNLAKINKTATLLVKSFRDILDLNKRINTSVLSTNKTYNNMLATIKAINKELTLTAKLSGASSIGSASKTTKRKTSGSRKRTASSAEQTNYVVDSYIFYPDDVLPPNMYYLGGGTDIERKRRFLRNPRLVGTSNQYLLTQDGRFLDSAKGNSPLSNNNLLNTKSILRLQQGIENTSDSLNQTSDSLKDTGNQIKSVGKAAGKLKAGFLKALNVIYDFTAYWAAASVGWNIGKMISENFKLSDTGIFKDMQNSVIGGFLAGVGQIIDYAMGGNGGKIDFGKGENTVGVAEANIGYNIETYKRNSLKLLKATNALTSAQENEYRLRIAAATTLRESQNIYNSLKETVDKELNASLQAIDVTKQLQESRRKLKEAYDEEAALLSGKLKKPLLTTEQIESLYGATDGYANKEQILRSIETINDYIKLIDMFESLGGNSELFELGRKFSFSNTDNIYKNSQQDIAALKEEIVTKALAQQKIGYGISGESIIPRNIVKMLETQSTEEVLKAIEKAAKSEKGANLGGVQYTNEEAKWLLSNVRGVFNKNALNGKVNEEQFRQAKEKNAEEIIKLAIADAHIVYKNTVDNISKNDIVPATDVMRDLKRNYDLVSNANNNALQTADINRIYKEITELNYVSKELMTNLGDRFNAINTVINEQLAKGKITDEDAKKLLDRYNREFLNETEKERATLENNTKKLTALREQLSQKMIESAVQRINTDLKDYMASFAVADLTYAPDYIQKAIAFRAAGDYAKESDNVKRLATELATATGQQRVDIEAKLSVSQAKQQTYRDILQKTSSALNERADNELAWAEKEKELGHITELELYDIRKKDADARLKNAKELYENALTQTKDVEALYALRLNVRQAKQRVQELALKQDEFYKQNENRVMSAISGFTSDRDKRGQLSNTALYHSLDLLSRISPQLINSINAQQMYNTGYSTTSANLNNAQEAQKQMAVAMDAYVIEQKRETANVGKNVKTIVDLLQENPLIRMN